MKKLIAIVGMTGSGKSIATEYLEQKGWTKIYFGGITYDRMREEGIEITLESETLYRENLRKQYGMGAYAILSLDKIKEAYKNGDTVLDGLYSWDELKILKEEFGDKLKVVAIVADRNIRYDRLKIRKERNYTKEQAEFRDLKEIENLAKGGPIAMADYYIDNNGDVDTYIKRLLEILEMI